MSYKDKCAKYKRKLEKIIKLENQKAGSTYNFIIIGNIRGKLLEFIPELTKQLEAINGNVYEYKFRFTNNRFKLDDLTFESVASDIKKFIDTNQLSDNIIICLEESSPYGLFFANTYPELAKAIIAYPLRLNTKESLDRLFHKFVDKKGWAHISKTYDPINYFFEINDKRLGELFDADNEETRNIIELLINLQLRKQHGKIPKKFKIQTFIYSRLDMDAASTIKLNFERKDIAQMKGILSPDDAIYNALMWNIARVQYDRELIELNNDNLRIRHMIAFENNEDVRFILDAVKVLLFP